MNSKKSYFSDLVKAAKKDPPKESLVDMEEQMKPYVDNILKECEKAAREGKSEYIHVVRYKEHLTPLKSDAILNLLKKEDLGVEIVNINNPRIGVVLTRGATKFNSDDLPMYKVIVKLEY